MGQEHESRQQPEPARPYDRATEREWLIQIREKRYWCRLILIVSVCLLIAGTVMIFVFAILAITRDSSPAAIVPLLESVGGIVTQVSGVVLFKFYDNLQESQMSVWERLTKMRTYPQRMADAKELLNQMTDPVKKNGLLTDMVRSLLNDQENP